MWGWLGGRRRTRRVCARRKLFGTLLGPEGTPVGVFSWVAAPGLSHLTVHALVSGVVGLVVWVVVGVWLFVECCIVDASIFLCLVLWFVRVCCV